MDKVYHVVASIKNEWDEWALVPAFSLTLGDHCTLQAVARRARLVVDHKGTETVRVQVLNEESNLYNAFTFEPITL